MKKLLCAVLMCVTALLFTVPVTAQQEGDDNTEPGPRSILENDDTTDQEPLYLADVVVTARRRPEDPFISNRSVSVYGIKDLKEKSPRTTPEALMEVPGVFVQKTNHAGGSPILRGLIGPQVLIYVDGVRLSNSVYRTGPLQYLNLVDPLSLERIEVLRGPGSVLYGSDAMGGVIQLFPITPLLYSGKTGLMLNGTFVTRYESADDGLTGHGHFRGGYNGLGFAGGVSKKKYDDLRAGGDIKVQPYSGYDQSSSFASMLYTVSDGILDGWRFSITYLMTKIEDAGRTDKLYDKKQLQLYDNEDHLVYGRINLRSKTLNTRGELTASYQYFREVKDNIALEDNLETRTSVTRDETEVDTIGADVKFITGLFGKMLELIYGGMWYHDMVDSKQLENTTYYGAWELSPISPYPDGSTYDNYGAYVMAEFTPLRSAAGHTVELSSGYRYHGMRGKADATNTLPAVDFRDSGHVFLGALKYLYEKAATVAFTFSQGFRSPNMQEAVQLGDTGKFLHIPNDELGPEKSDTYELLGRIAFWKIRLGASGYVSFITDIINREDTTWQGQALVNGKTVVHNVNGGEAVIYGGEGDMTIGPFYGVSLSGMITYTWGEEERESGEKVPVTRIPPLYGQATLRWETPAGKRRYAFLETFVRAAGKQDRLSPEDESDVRIPEGGTPGWWTLNVRGGIFINKRYRVTAAVENIFNEKYKYHASGVYSPGLNTIITLDASF